MTAVIGVPAVATTAYSLLVWVESFQLGFTLIL